MTLDRAKKIVSDCVAHVWYREALTTDPPPSLAEYTLQELLDANRLVAGPLGKERDEENKSTTVSMHCDDRLVAALYVLYHYPAVDPTGGPVDVLVANASAGVVTLKLLTVVGGQ